ncbi:MAG: zinc ABC transporter solute-binding protein [Lewinella sp.]|nr:zinc ABC transporter solute-binding protein [Lewinella sp.]
MSAQNGLLYATNIRDALSELDPANAEAFRFNANMYLGQLRDLDAYIQAQIDRIPEAQRVLITSHDAFRYYGRRYQLRVEAALGTSTDAQVQTDDVARLNRTIQSTMVPAIFVETTINPKLIRQIASDNKVIIGGYLYADSLGEPGGEADTYLKMLRHNTDAIVRGLLGQSNDNGAGLGPTFNQQLLLLGIVLAVMLGAFFFTGRATQQGHQ